MFVSTIIPATQQIPARSQVRSIYASALHPSGEWIPVRILYFFEHFGPDLLPDCKFFQVRGLAPTDCDFSVPTFAVKNVSFFVTLEVSE